MSNTAHSIDTTASQIAAVSASAERLDRARAYSARLDAHAAELRARLDAAAGDATSGPLRGELVDLDRQRRQAAVALSSVEAEHARHAADLAALYGADGQARAKLAEAHQARAGAETAVDAAKAVLDRAKAHAEGVEGRLAAARAAEARHDAAAADRLHAALRDGTEAPVATAPLNRTAAGLEDDARAARAAEVRAASEHRTKAAALAEAERQVRGAADAVMLAEADAMAREVAALDARADLLRARLTTYSARLRGDYVAPAAAAPDPTRNPWSPPPLAVAYQAPPAVASSPAIASVMKERAYVQERPHFSSRDAAAWDAYAAALAADPQAEPDFTDTPTATPFPSLPVRAA